MSVLTDMNYEATILGRTMGALFLLKEVRYMPHIKGIPSQDWLKSIGATDLKTVTSKLPADYMAADAEKIINRLIEWAGEEAVREGLSVWLLRISYTWHNFSGAMSFSKAKSSVSMFIRNEISSVRRASKSCWFDDSVDVTCIDDPEQMKVKPLWKEPKVRQLLETCAHPEAPAYLDLLMDGYSGVDIIGNIRQGQSSMLTTLKAKPMTCQNWSLRIMPKIVAILKAEA